MAGFGSLFSLFSGIKGKLLLTAGVMVLAGLGLNSLDLLDPDKGVSAESDGSTMQSSLVERSNQLAEYSRSATWGDAAIRLPAESFLKDRHQFSSHRFSCLLVPSLSGAAGTFLGGLHGRSRRGPDLDSRAV